MRLLKFCFAIMLFGVKICVFRKQFLNSYLCYFLEKLMKWWSLHQNCHCKIFTDVVKVSEMAPVQSFTVKVCCPSQYFNGLSRTTIISVHAGYLCVFYK